MFILNFAPCVFIMDLLIFFFFGPFSLLLRPSSALWQSLTSVTPCFSGDLPPRLLALDCYPSHPVRINSYSKAKYLIDIFNILYGTPELQLLLQSPLGSLFSLPVRYCSLSGQLLHQLLCRQLFTEEIDATWFVFAGQPLRFSLKEFEEITSLCCSEYPSAAEVRFSTSYADGESPY